MKAAVLLCSVLLVSCKSDELEIVEKDYTSVAYDLLASELTPLQGATVIEEAAQTLIVPNEDEAWLIENLGEEAFVTFEIEDWMGTLHLFITEGYAVDVELEQSLEQSPSAGCPGYTEQRYKITAWGSYPVHIQGAGDISLSVIHD